MKVCAIVPSAGSGRRMHSKIDKPLIKLCGKEIILHVLAALEDSPLIYEVIVAARPKNIPLIKKLIKQNKFSKVKKVIKGGGERAESVLKALSEASPAADFVLVHDVARPFITGDLIRKTLKAAKRYGAALTAVGVKPTIKEATPKGDLVAKTLDRNLLWEAQTPQAFRRDLLTAAYKKIGKKAAYFTDDASLVENLRKSVKIVKGSYCNIKITTPEDLIIAEAIFKRRCHTG